MISGLLRPETFLMARILHIVQRADWEAAAACGEYRPPSLGTEGFIHCSTERQVVAVADLLFRGRPDLVLLVIDERKLPPVVKYEGGLRAGPFPHVYGPLPAKAVVAVLPFPCGPDGTFALPGSLAADGAAAEPTIDARPMNPEEIVEYARSAMAEHVSELVLAGAAPAEAEEEARRGFAPLTSAEPIAPDHRLFTLLDRVTGKPAGTIWYRVMDRAGGRMVYLCDLFLDPAFRGRGFGGEAMAFVEAEARRLGARSIALHVFGHNTAARALYERCGFRPTSLVLRRELP
jgi:uncharacterized protein (DUF952 family)/RimJ/RimL family protein N-acetyltransferase